MWESMGGQGSAAVIRGPGGRQPSGDEWDVMRCTAADLATKRG